MHRVFDVAVFGAGPAGSLTAKLLSERGFKVVVLEDLTQFGFKSGETLPGEAKPLLAKCKLLEAFASVAKWPSAGNYSTWGSDHVLTRSSVINPYGGGWHLDRQAFDQMLRDEAFRVGVEIRYGQRTRHIRRQVSSWEIEVTSEQRADKVVCTWAVDATGRRSAFARKVGARRLIQDRLVGVVGTISKASGADHNVLVEAVEDGWWYSAQIPSGSRVGVFFTDADAVQRLGVKSPIEWLRRIKQTKLISQRLSEESSLGLAPKVLLADTSRLARVAGEGWVAVGDAASALDPLASLGLMQAMRGAMGVADLVSSTLNSSVRVDSYARIAAEEHKARDTERIRYYALEQRWNSSAFWRRRHQGTVVESNNSPKSRFTLELRE